MRSWSFRRRPTPRRPMLFFLGSSLVSIGLSTSGSGASGFFPILAFSFFLFRGTGGSADGSRTAVRSISCTFGVPHSL